MILNGIMMFQTSSRVKHTCNLALSGKQISKKSRMFVVAKLSYSARHVFRTKQEGVNSTDGRTESIPLPPPRKNKLPCPPDISFQRQTNGSVIGKNHLACTLLFVHGKSPEKNTSLSDFFHRLPGKDESSKLFFFHEEPNFQGNLRTPWKTRFGKIW